MALWSRERQRVRDGDPILLQIRRVAFIGSLRPRRKGSIASRRRADRHYHLG